MLEKNIILNNNLKVLIIALVATLYCHCAYAYSNSDFDKNIRVAMTESKLTGVAVTVFQGDKILFSKGYGYANIDAAIPMSTTAVFRVASLSKMVTAMARGRMAPSTPFISSPHLSPARYGYRSPAGDRSATTAVSAPALRVRAVGRLKPRGLEGLRAPHARKGAAGAVGNVGATSPLRVWKNRIS